MARAAYSSGPISAEATGANITIPARINKDKTESREDNCLARFKVVGAWNLILICIKYILPTTRRLIEFLRDRRKCVSRLNDVGSHLRFRLFLCCRGGLLGRRE